MDNPIMTETRPEVVLSLTLEPTTGIHKRK
jgi:hypothetical protein